MCLSVCLSVSQSVMKEKMLLRLERDRLLGKVDTLQRQTTKKSEAGEVGAGATTATGAGETSLQQPSTSTAPQARLKGGPSQTEGGSTEGEHTSVTLIPAVPFVRRVVCRES